MKKLESATIGRNVKKIHKGVFLECKSLKKIRILTTKLKRGTIGIKAFEGISPKAVIRVPKEKLKLYMTLLQQKGLPKTAKIK